MSVSARAVSHRFLRGVSRRLAVATVLLCSALAMGSAAANQPPTADLNVMITNYAIDVIASTYDADGTVTWFLLDYGDGATTTSLTSSHTYGAPGVYTLTVTLIDNEGAMGVHTRTIYISGRDST